VNIPPVRLPRARDKLVSYWRGEMAPEVISQAPVEFPVNLPGIDCERPETFACQGSHPDIMHARRFCERIAGQLSSEETGLYWVSQEFSQLAREIAEDLDDLPFVAEEMPCESGLLVWQGPIAEFAHGGARASVATRVQIVAASWFTLPGGIWITLYCDPRQVLQGVPVERLTSEIGGLMPIAPGGGAVFGHYGREQIEGVAAMLIATWLLLAQPGVADVSDGPTEKRAVRQYARRGRRYPGVRVVNLRRRPVPEAAEYRNDADHDGRFERRWIKSHLKWQAYGPGRSQRRRIVIARYLRGPKDAPIVGAAPVATVKTLR
jgi:hypothetical protein